MNCAACPPMIRYSTPWRWNSSAIWRSGGAGVDSAGMGSDVKGLAPGGVGPLHSLLGGQPQGGTDEGEVDAVLILDGFPVVLGGIRLGGRRRQSMGSYGSLGPGWKARAP